MFISPNILEEIIRVLDYPRIRERVDTKETTLLLKCLKSEAGTVRGELKLDVLTLDPTDNVYLACAVEAKCEFLVTGNEKHFQEAGSSFHGIKIISPRAFLNFLNE